MWDRPLPIHRIAMKSPSDLIINSTRPHRPPRVPYHLQKFFIPLAERPSQKEKWLTGPRKFWRTTEPAVLSVILHRQLIPRRLQNLLRIGNRPPARAFSQQSDSCGKLLRPAHHLPVSILPGAGNLPQHIHKSGPPITAGRRIVGAPIKRFPFRSDPNGKRPSPLTRHRLHRRHVDPVDIRPLLPVHFHRNKIPVQHLRHRLALKRLPFHHMTPVTRRITDA